MTCAYCGTERAVNMDHVVPKSLAKKHPELPEHLRETVPACWKHNILKGTRRLVPPSWSDRVPELNEFFGGTEFRVWYGDVSEPAYRETW